MAFTGCASRTAYVIARRDTQFNLSRTNKISLAGHPHPRESELALQSALVSALQERGITLVPSDQSEFTLTYWLDDSWKPGKKVQYYYHGTWWDSYPTAASALITSPDLLYIDLHGGMYREEPRIVSQRVVDSPYYIQGIRLKLYPKNSAGAVQFQAAWEGYIEGGTRVYQKRQPVLLRTLLNYYGKDFNGRAPLIEQHD